MKRTLTCLILLWQTINCNSQELKTYNGDYSLKGYTDLDNLPYTLEGGKATYMYLEDSLNGERIKHGVFNYQLKLEGWTEMITGSYLNGLKHGQWTHTVTKTDYPNEAVEGEYQTIRVLLKANYVNGQPDSSWTLTYSEKHRRKVWYNGVLVWGKYSPDYTLKSNAEFRVGTLVGKCNTVIMEGSVKIIENKAIMRRDGFLLDAKFLNRDEEDAYAFKDGCLMKISTHNPHTGQVKSTDDYSADIDCLMKHQCESDTAQLWSVLNGKMISDELFHLTGLSGDLTIRYDVNEDKLLRNYKGAYFIRKRK